MTGKDRLGIFTVNCHVISQILSNPVFLKNWA